MPNIREVTLQELTNSIAILRKQYKCKPSESIGKSIYELVDERNKILHSMRINEND
ncbi:MAG: hypothetical protein WAK14_01645 [Methanobacterium sp.]